MDNELRKTILQSSENGEWGYSPITDYISGKYEAAAGLYVFDRVPALSLRENRPPLNSLWENRPHSGDTKGIVAKRMSEFVEYQDGHSSLYNSAHEGMWHFVWRQCAQMVCVYAISRDRKLGDNELMIFESVKDLLRSKLDEFQKIHSKSVLESALAAEELSTPGIVDLDALEILAQLKPLEQSHIRKVLLENAILFKVNGSSSVVPPDVAAFAESWALEDLDRLIDSKKGMDLRNAVRIVLVETLMEKLGLEKVIQLLDGDQLLLKSQETKAQVVRDMICFILRKLWTLYYGSATEHSRLAVLAVTGLKKESLVELAGKPSNYQLEQAFKDFDGKTVTQVMSECRRRLESEVVSDTRAEIVYWISKLRLVNRLTGQSRRS